MTDAAPLVRVARPADVPALVAFGASHIRSHYAPLIGADAADQQVRTWWNETHLGAAVDRGLVLVAEDAAAEDTGRVVAVAQWGPSPEGHAVYKLYVEPGHRGAGLGVRLLDAVVARLPADAGCLQIEHFAANERAGAFYEREGFTVERIEPDPTGDPALAVVWRSRHLA